MRSNPYKNNKLQESWYAGYTGVDLTELNSTTESLHAWNQGKKDREQDILRIPKGSYCYHGSRAPNDSNYSPCPFWELREIKEGEFTGEKFGYCTLLNIGDFSYDETQETSLLLIDQIKECNLNSDFED